MSVLICKMCGGDLEIKEGMTTVRCPYCGTNQTLPKFDSEKRLRMYDRANHFRRSNDYDKAMTVYEQILNEDQTDSEAYWSIVLCRYGIEYVEDPATHRRIPTVNRMQYTSVLADEDYKEALRYADVVQAKLYEQEATAIDAIQKGIFQVSNKEAPYDIFICYKETDEHGSRTRDSVLADELYYQLTRNGYRVFCARITLQNKPGVAYEPYIFGALHSARAMIVVGTSRENFQAVWVRNEWSRYLTLIKQGEHKVLIPAYRDMDPYDLPTEFSHLQALDMSRLGFLQDLNYGIRKILEEDTVQDVPKGSAKPGNISLTDADRIDHEISEEKVHRTGWELYGRKGLTALGIGLIAVILLINIRGIYQWWKADHGDRPESKQQLEKMEEELTKFHVTWADSITMQENQTTQEEQAEQGGEFTGILEEFVSRVYQCPAKDVTDSQLAKIQQIVMRRENDLWHIGYSFDPPAENGLKGFEETTEDDTEDELIWVDFISDADVDLGGLSRFTQTKRLDVCYPLTAEDVKGLQLQSVSAYFDNPAEAAEILENPGAIKELGFNGIMENLDGIDRFESLETLYIGYSDINNIDSLIYADHLKNLYVASDGNLTDFTVIGKLTNLEELYLDVYGLKVFDFIGNLENLEILKVTDAQIQTLSGLENCTELKSLTINYCMQLKDTSAVSALENLQELDLEVPYGCMEPELDSLTGLKKLSLDGQVEDCSFLQNMSELTDLHLSGCSLQKGLDLSNLKSLRSLSCTNLKGFDWKVDALTDFQMVECLDLQGTETYDDISGIFNMPNLKELNISGMSCEIDFDAVAENHSLEVLHMDGMYLYENVDVDYASGIIMASMDELALSDHMDFFKKFPELRELYLTENGLTDLSFAEELSALEVLDISGNYITQLRPLAGLPSLQKVICSDNPLKNEKVLKDSVLIIRDTEKEYMDSW